MTDPEHVSADQDERNSEHTAQAAFDHVKAVGDIRAALRPGSF